MSKQVDDLVNALSAGQLVGGSALIVEDLDLTGIGMYTEEQKQELLKSGVPENDFFLTNLCHFIGWVRKSEEGVKWQIFEDKQLKP